MMSNFPEPQDRQSPQHPQPAQANDWEPPPTVANAIKLMYAGGAAFPIIALINVLTGLAVIRTVADALPVAAVWYWMARKNHSGRSWARVLSTVFFGIQTIAFAVLAVRLAPNITDLTSAGLIWVVGLTIYWIIGLGTIVLLWRPQSNEYYARMRGRVN
jgi:hypothetical protein